VKTILVKMDADMKSSATYGHYALGGAPVIPPAHEMEIRMEFVGEAGALMEMWKKLSELFHPGMEVKI